jgi:hypothetical protein
MSTVYTTKQDSNYGEILVMNGINAICPFQAPAAVPQQNALGQVQVGFNRMPCSTICPFASILKDGDEEDDKSFYTIDCGNQSMTFEIQEVSKVVEPKLESKVINLL